MARPRVAAGGGFAAIGYTLRKAREAGGIFRLYRRLRSRNACKTCALGMGGQRGGMVNELGHFPEVCKKSVQAQVGDMAGGISEEFFQKTSIEEMKALTSAQCERLGRLAFPVLAEEGDTHFRRTTWREALNRTADALRSASPEEVFFYSSGRASNEAAFLMQLVARAYGTANIHNCSYYCHQASGVALGHVYGSGTASVVLEDLDHCDLALVIGANPASNHPRLITKLIQLRRRGGQVIVINPLRELGLVRFRVPSDVRSLLFGTRIADLYLQPHVGSDIALLKALLKGLLEEGGVDVGYVHEFTSGWDVLARDLESASWDSLLAACGVPRTEVVKAIEMLRTASRGIFMWAMRLTHHQHGVDNVLALANLAMARGWLGRPGTGLLPIRGHSNVQGVGSVGVSPALKNAFAGRLKDLYGFELPREAGMDTFACMEAAHAGKIRTAVLLGATSIPATPTSPGAGGALRTIPHTLSVTTKWNPGHVHGRGRTALVVPALARDEEPQATTQESMFNFVRLSEGGSPAVMGEMRSEVEIISALAERILPEGRFDWSRMRNHRHLREQIAQVVPGYEAIGVIDDSRREFQIEGRTFHSPMFGSPETKARFSVTPLPEQSLEPGEFRLTTLRSEGQFNTVVYEEGDLYRGTTRRDVVMMSAEDAERMGLDDGSRVVVQTETDQMEVVVAVVPIRSGNLAMYYPEANALVPRRIDERSKTPAFKCIRARVRPQMIDV